MRRTRVLLFALLGLGILAPGHARAQCARCPEASFGPAARTFGTDLVYSYKVAVADFNGDGIPDVVAGDNQGVVVFLGLGDGNFGAPISTAVPHSLPGGKVEVGDFNGDGRPDLVVQHYLGEIMLLPGGGNGRFMAPAGTGILARTFAVFDVDRDGRLDIVALTLDVSVVVLRGDGHGSFTPLPGVPTTISGASLAVGDLNGDGFADVVVTDYPSLAVFMGSAAGVGPPAVMHTGSSLAGLTIGDVTGDGKLDVIGTANFPANTVVYPGDGAGGFGSPISVAMGSGPNGYAVADLDGDGNPDLLAQSYQYSEIVTRRGDGAGGFGPARSFFSLGAGSLVLADVDGDGIPDAVTGNGYAVNVALGDGTGGLGVLSTPAGEEARGVVMADFDGDGKVDLATVEGSPPNILRIRKGHGDGTWETFNDDSIAFVSDVLAAVDLNGDTKPDLVLVSGPTALQTVLNDGTGHFVEGPASPAGCQPLPRPAVADFNADGRADLALPCFGSIIVRLGDGAGGFAPPVTLAAGARWIAPGDVNGDGKIDLVSVAPSSNQVLVSLGDGLGNFGAPIGSSLPGIEGLALADFDKDGLLDVAGASFQNGDFVTIGYGDGTGHFGRARSFPAQGFRSVTLSADLDGDGWPDVVAANGGTIALFMNDGSGGLLAARGYGAAGLEVAAARVDGDALLDLVAVSARPPLVTTLLNTSCKARHLAFLPATRACSPPAAPIEPPPAVRVVDDGGNLVTCAAGSVAASLVSGTPSAVLSGTVAVPVSGGIASFTDLRIDLPGAYRLGFAHSLGARPSVGGIRIGAGVSVSIAGSPLVCGSDPAVYDAGPGYSTYGWFLDGAPAGFAQLFFAPFLGPGAHTLSLVAGMGICEGTASTSISNAPPTASSITPASGSPGGFTSVVVIGTCFARTATFSLGGIGALSSAAVSSTSLFGETPRHAAGKVDVVVTNPDGQAATLPAAYTYLASTGAYPLPPCRIFDSRRLNGPLGGPVLQPHTWRPFFVSGVCGVPPGAVALIVNATVTQPVAAGGMRVLGATSTEYVDFLSFTAGQTRANNGILMLPLDGPPAVWVYNDSPGTAHFILDVTGYFY